MGKHKKFLKSEKAKVKLKGNKLLAAQNVTKTDFKIRKIIIPDQLKNVQQLKDVGQIKHHNVVDCMARLKNSSSAEALHNLKDIIIRQPMDFQKHLESIIKIVANLSLSIEKNDRKECYKLMGIIFTNSSINNLRPFFSILVSYLRCAMTHIKPAIQEDSLSMLDVLLANAPELVAAEKDNILPPYLDMISKMRAENKPERTLSLQLGNKITTIRWRKSVMERLISLLRCISKKYQPVGSSAGFKAREIVVDKSTFFLGNLSSHCMSSYYQQIPISQIESQFTITVKEGELSDEIDESEKIKNYIEMIMPLMFETWLEIKPNKAQASVDGENTSFISNENAYMLKVIMDIINQLFDMVKLNDVNREWFLATFYERFASYLLPNFPYCQDDKATKNKTEIVGGEKCVYQNLHICYMFLWFQAKNKQRFSKHKAKVFDFVNDCISYWKLKDSDFNHLLSKFIKFLFEEDTKRMFQKECKQIFSNLIQRHDTNRQTKENDVKLLLLCHILEGNNNVDTTNESFSAWLPKLFEILTLNEYIPVHIIDTFTSLAKHNIENFRKLLNDQIVQVIENLFKAKVSTSTNELEWKKQIGNLLYWVSDTSNLPKVQQLLHTNQKEHELCSHIREIVNFKTCA